MTDDEAPADTAAPTTLDTAAVDGATLALTWDEMLDAGSVPAAGAFTVTVAGPVRAMSGVAVAGGGVTLTLAPAAEHGDGGPSVALWGRGFLAQPLHIWSGWRKGAQSPLAMRFAVLSLPAIMMTPRDTTASVVVLVPAAVRDCNGQRDRVDVLTIC